MKKAKKQTKTTENRPVTSGNLPQGSDFKIGLIFKKLICIKN